MTTDPEALLSRKGPGKEAKLNYLGHVVMENRHGLAVQTELTQATGTAEREAAVTMITAQAPAGGVTLGADKNYDTQGCVAQLRDAGVTPHVAQNTGRRGGSAIDGRTTRHPGYALSQRTRKRVEEIFGWLKTVGGMRKTRFRGRHEWAGCSPGRWRPTIWSACAICCGRRKERERCLQSANIALSGAMKSPPGRASDPYLSILKTLDSAEFYF